MVILDKNGAPTGMAKCSKCGKIKPLSAFHKKKSTKYGIRSTCKECAARERKAYYEDNKEKEFATHSVYENANRGAINAKRAERRRNSLDYYKKHHRYVKRRLKEDVDFLLIYRLRNRAVRAFEVSGCKSVFTYRELFGCSIPEYRKYIEGLFDEDMNWEGFLNREIHIDHIIPCSYFDLSKPENQLICFHYLNTRPLWAKENLSKRNTITISQAEKQALIESIRTALSGGLR